MAFFEKKNKQTDKNINSNMKKNEKLYRHFHSFATLQFIYHSFER